VVPAETAIVAIGQEPRPELADLIESVDPATGRTGTPKLYAAGDAVNGGATVVEAVREAKIAARSVDEDLQASAP
jgi:glutamate synthase (NADPH/NADH) small chain